MRADRRKALLDFLLKAVADEGTTPFLADVLAGLRSVVQCESISYWEWSAHKLMESSLAADDPESSLRVWDAYPRSGRTIRSPAGRRAGARCPTRNGSGTFAISDFISDRQFRNGALYAEVCKPLGVRAVMKAFLPTGAATGASLVLDTTRSRFTETDRLTLQSLAPHLAQLRRNAYARRTYPALTDSTAAARIRLLRLSPRERVVLRRLRPARPVQRSARLSRCRARCPPPGPAAGRFPCSLPFARRRRSPAVSRRPRHRYAADFPCGLPGLLKHPARKFPPQR